MNKNQLKATIFDVQGFSVHDGPGCRTTVFFAGCPLRCKWCANPENFAGRRQLMYAKKVCKWGSGCRACVDICPYGAIIFNESEAPTLKWDLCKKCKTFECANICAANALRVCGKEYTVDELMDILKRDFNNWGPDGGVTFSGGEALLQYDFLLEVLKRCYKSYIHTAVETSANINTKKILELFKYINFAFIDIKHMDPKKHFDGTGVSNELILKNISELKKTRWAGRLVIRQATIGGFNDDKENALAVIEFMKENGLEEINLLPFHRMGQTKWEQLGLTYPYMNAGDVTRKTLEELQLLYLQNDILCYIGDKTPF